MPTTYAAAVSLADSQYLDNNPHGWVPGFDKEPAKFLQDVVQPYADAGIRLMLHNAFGRGGKTRTFSKRFDGQAAAGQAIETIQEMRDLLEEACRSMDRCGLLSNADKIRAYLSK